MNQDDAISCYRLSYQGVSAICQNTAKLGTTSASSSSSFSASASLGGVHTSHGTSSSSSLPPPTITSIASECRRRLVRLLLRMGADPLLPDRQGTYLPIALSHPLHAALSLSYLCIYLSSVSQYYTLLPDRQSTYINSIVILLSCSPLLCNGKSLIPCLTSPLIPIRHGCRPLLCKGRSLISSLTSPTLFTSLTTLPHHHPSSLTGMGAVHYCAREDLFDCMLEIIRAGHEVADAKTPLSQTPLHVACKAGEESCIECPKYTALHCTTHRNTTQRYKPHHTTSLTLSMYSCVVVVCIVAYFSTIPPLF